MVLKLNFWLSITLCVAILSRPSIGLKFVNVSIRGLGQCQGVQERTVAGNVDVFKGIPFAKPPIGALRFQAPQDTSWTGLLNATKFGHMCPQWSSRSKSHVGHEDCLTLNVHRPSNATSAGGGKLTVMVWVHGGGYVKGGSVFVAGNFLSVAQNVIVVTFNYRLGVLGFFNVPGTDIKGNYGMLDQVQALRWVKRNIRSFGGNPNDVTIFGESAGAYSVSLLTLSPLLKNEALFHRAILQSGVATCPSAAQQVFDDKTALKFGKATGCSEKRSIADCLRKRPLSEIIKSQVGIKNPDLTRPVVDGYFLEELPSKQDAMGRLQFSADEILLGFNRDEGTFFAGDRKTASKSNFAELLRKTIRSQSSEGDTILQSAAMFEYSKFTLNNSAMDWFYSKSDFLGDYTFVKNIKKFPDSIMRSGKKAFLYEFVYLPEHLRKPYLKVSHVLDLDFVFGSPMSGDRFYMLAKATEQDKRVSRNVMEMWARFAKTGNPGKNWPEYTTSDKKYLEIGANLTVKRSYTTKRDSFWNEFVPTVLRATSTKPCKKNTSSNPRLQVSQSTIFLAFILVLYNTCWRFCAELHHSPL
eukprot:gene17341-19072_t